jgi:peptidase M48-like protein
MGQEVFNELRAKGEIIESSPLYEQLKPIADAITKAAQPRYNHPFKFYLVHETQPNAFATPGGNVYVVDSLLYFVKNTEELAGTLCHEVSHTIHHDTVTLMEKQQQLEKREVGAAVLLGPLVRTCWPSFCSESFIRWATRETSNHALTLRAPTCAPLRTTTRGDSYGCSRILRTRRLARYHSFYRITPMTKIEFIR